LFIYHLDSCGKNSQSADFWGRDLSGGTQNATRRAIIFRHVLPNAINPVIVQAALGVGFAIITESSLSFIGLGAQPPTPSWGSMVQVGFQYLELAPLLALAPAAAIFVAVLGFNLLGEGLRDLLDPNARLR